MILHKLEITDKNLSLYVGGYLYRDLLKMEAVCSSESLVATYQITRAPRCHNTEKSNRKSDTM